MAMILNTRPELAAFESSEVALVELRATLTVYSPIMLLGAT
jgi:hypothetical protein